MIKSSITQKRALTAYGILAIDDDGYICIESADDGELIDLRDLLSDFANKSVKLYISYECDYGSDDY